MPRESSPSTPLQVLRETRQAIRCRRSWMRLAASLSLTAAATLVLFGVVFGLALVKGESMRPAFREMDMVLFLRTKDVKKGDAVILRMDDSCLDKVVKRVIGMPGDTVDIDGQGRVLVNAAVLDEPYIYSETPRKAADFPLKLGNGEYFVLGDNRENSHDSRSFGKVLRGQVDGRVLAALRIGSGA